MLSHRISILSVFPRWSSMTFFTWRSWHSRLSSWSRGAVWTNVLGNRERLRYNLRMDGWKFGLLDGLRVGLMMSGWMDGMSIDGWMEWVLVDGWNEYWLMGGWKGWLYGWIEVWLDGELYRWMNGWLCEWIDGRMVGWINGWLDWLVGCSDGKFGSFQRFGSAPLEEPALTAPKWIFI